MWLMKEPKSVTFLNLCTPIPSLTLLPLSYYPEFQNPSTKWTSQTMEQRLALATWDPLGASAVSQSVATIGARDQG